MTNEELKLIQQLIGEIQKLTKEVSKIKEALRNVSNKTEKSTQFRYFD